MWFVFFELSRIIFLLYNHTFSFALPFSTICKSFVYGFQHDASMLGYLVAFSSLCVIISLFVKYTTPIVKLLRISTIIFLTIFSLITFADAELYRNWGYRMDCSALQYLTMPKEALGSIPLWHLLSLLFAVAVFVYFFTFLYKKYVEKCIFQFEPIKPFYIIAFLVVIGFCVIPIRGGIGVAALRTGSVYFSSEAFANHAAINDHWHFLNSFGYSSKIEADVFMDEKNCDDICSNLFQSSNNQPIQLLRTKRPNILIFILESFTASHMESLGGKDGVTPNLDSIARAGVSFSNCYANGSKSEVGIVSILSGYPAQPTTAIIKYTEKAEKLPYLSKSFDSLGYNLSFFHGGDIRYGNMNSYFRNGGFNTCITIDDFDKKDGNSKWGILDHVVFNRLFDDLHKQQEPFFSVCYTLSSHEPFEVPMNSEFNGDSEPEKFLNSVHYTDSCIGDFMRRAKSEPWWNNTLVIFVADHGSRIPHSIMWYEKVKFRIPMIWSGGAISSDTTISELMSQCDLPKLVCNQLDLPSEQFYFSKDVLRGDTPFAFYAFNDGFAYLRENQYFSWDNDNSAIQIVSKSDELSDTTIQQGQAIIQKVTTDFCRK